MYIRMFVHISPSLYIHIYIHMYICKFIMIAHVMYVCVPLSRSLSLSLSLAPYIYIYVYMWGAPVHGLETPRPPPRGSDLK